MKDDKDWFSEDAPKGFADRVLAKAEPMLKEKRSLNQRRWILFLLPSLAMSAAAFFWLRLRSDNQGAAFAKIDMDSLEMGQMLVESDELTAEGNGTDQFELLADLDVLEDFDEVEEFAKSESQES